ncbi:MAG: hypothetical protein NDI90_19640 [Nitrospira sp. BO4]|jgi:hypothetical protein|nr:hypothetical protein [Nitrospira sp. BO4]MDK2745117.1 hypothetical protein [Nitrospira sp. BO4]
MKGQDTLNKHKGIRYVSESDGSMDFIRQEVNLFVYASEHLLGDGVLPEELTTDERDIIQYYLVSMAGKFPVACRSLL